MITPPVYNDLNFRAQFPQFQDETKYPPAALQFAWNMGSNWLDQNCQACWGFTNSVKWQMAADLMGAVITYQMFGPQTTQSMAFAQPPGFGEIGPGSGGQTYSTEGEAPGAVQSATEGSVTASFQLPEIGTSAFSSMLLASPPYGRMLLALLQITASVGPYIPSRRPSWIPP